MAKHVKKDVNYSVGSGVVNLRLVIGEGQLGTATGLLDSNLLFIGSLIDMSIGHSDIIKGKKLYIDSSIKDVRPDTDETIVTIELTDDANSQTITSEGKAEQNGGTVIHDIEISLL
ncbi:hypothetical protein [Marivirga sp.]|uniref:hypothetical protein n=1 Tax=Marivirga sp. TaxID=2018662 RepID=UPI003DA6CEC6